MEGDLQKLFGRNLRRYRQTKGMSQEDFAEFLGMHRTYFGAIERGSKNLTLRSMERIGAKIDVDPRVLLSDEFRS